MNSLKLKLFKMTILNFKHFMKKYDLKNDIINESHLQSYKEFIIILFILEIRKLIQIEELLIQTTALKEDLIGVFFLKKKIINHITSIV